MINGVEAIPYAIKPNIHELKEIVEINEKGRKLHIRRWKRFN